jgi:hypothetical protein
VKTIIQEAINSFEFEHEFRCGLIKKNCKHQDLIQRAQEYEKCIHKNIANEIAVRLGEVRDDWLIVEDIKEGSMAEFIQLIFNTAIGFCDEIK